MRSLQLLVKMTDINQLLMLCQIKLHNSIIKHVYVRNFYKAVSHVHVHVHSQILMNWKTSSIKIGVP